MDGLEDVPIEYLLDWLIELKLRIEALDSFDASVRDAKIEVR